MKRNGLHWSRSGLFAAALLTLQATATASQTHTLKPGESLFTIANHYHVSVRDIARANNLKNMDRLKDGTRLIIPDAPPHTILRAYMYKPAKIHGDRVSVRTQPFAEAARVTMFDAGAPVVVTAEKQGWSQVTLTDGKTGWIRSDFLQAGRQGAKPVQTASLPLTPPRSRRKPHVPALAADNRRQVVRRAAQGRHAETVARASEKLRSAKYRVRLAATQKRREEKAKLAALRRKNRWQLAKETKGKRNWQIAQERNRGWQHRAHSVRAEADRPEPTTDIVRTAYAYRGTPYRYGGSARGGFDCSGFTSYLYRQKGVSLPHSARAQFKTGQHVDKGSLKAGDLVFFHTVTPGISHVGMYVGNGKFVHSSSRRSGGVRVDSLDAGYYRKAYRGATRVKK